VHSGQGGTQAEVGSGGEAEVGIGVAADVERGVKWPNPR
jgi:hypothetical protein